MLESIPNTFDECKRTLKESMYFYRSQSSSHHPLTDIKLDEGFRDFFNWTKTVDIPVILVSRCPVQNTLRTVLIIPVYSGMAPLIRAVLSNLIGEEEAQHIEIISNDVKINEDGSWKIQYRHPTR